MVIPGGAILVLAQIWIPHNNYLPIARFPEIIVWIINITLAYVIGIANEALTLTSCGNIGEITLNKFRKSLYQLSLKFVMQVASKDLFL